MSFDIAITGLNAFTKQLSGISNNIANTGTAGYKSMRTEFQSLYGGGQPLGVGISRVSQSMGLTGTLTDSARNLDLAINGGGLFVLKGNDGRNCYSRAGYFECDKDGYIVNNLNNRLQGYPVNAAGELQTGVVGDLKMGTGNLPAKATSKLELTANLDARAKTITKTPFNPEDKDTYNNTSTTKVYDSLGVEHSMTQCFVKTGAGTWEAHYYVDGKPASQPTTPAKITFDNNGVMTAPTGPVSIQFTPDGAAPLTVNVDYTGTTQFGSDFNVSKNNPDGYTTGVRTGEEIDQDGKIHATYSNGQRALQGQVVLAGFSNLDGLESTNGTAWYETSSSGQPIIGEPKSGLNGDIKSKHIEGSNVDMASELVGLMSAQRNYQANTKVISTNDQMMTALFQAV